MALYRAGLAAGASRLGPLLEVGTYCAKSAVYLGAAARETGAMLFSVDHHRGSEELQSGWPQHDPEVIDAETGRTDTLPWARRTLERAGLESNVVLIVGESATVAAYWQTPLSLLFIDGGHGEGPAWADYGAWAPKLARGGILAIHDVFTDPEEGGQVPYEVYKEALRAGGFSRVERGSIGSLRLLGRL
ncbi:MAG TPA: class I SAM-dependent methyltransferase [Acidimicrobiales bacterium]|nr:class I SAM-dependent methyltransferase [Acidimicrobiales bacterium]